MVPDRWIPPKIMFAVLNEGGRITAKFGYLVRIGDQAWAYADLMEVGKLPHEAAALPLDPQRIVEETNTETGETYFAYRGELGAFPG